ncbi:MAG TPA: ABC transporter permease [Vicinamibacterales bacterium]|nr:ABC transporter permease [Vicinamibacterales bacterium]
MVAWLRRVLNTLRPARIQQDIDRELAFHLAERVDELRAQGLPEPDAKRRARLQFGNPLVQRERTRDVDVADGLDALARHVRYAVRALLRAPGFTITAVLTLALGIGANSAVFSAMDRVLLRALPFPDANRLMYVTQTSDGAGDRAIAGVRIDDWNRANSTFEAITGYHVEDVSDTTGDQPERIQRATVLPRFLEVWGIEPVIGRGFTGAEHRMGGPQAILISERYWRRRFGADAAVLNKSVRITGRSYPIVGVLPASFMFPERDADWWVPEWVDAPWMLPREYSSYVTIGRLKPGTTLEQARDDLAAVQRRLGDQYPRTDRDIRPKIVPLKEMFVENVRASLWLLFGAVSLLLLIACTNIASLQLSRATRRQHEIAVRYSLGASPASVIAQLLTESGVLAFAGAVAGLLIAVGASAAFRLLAPDVPRLEDAAINARIVLYTTAWAVVVALLCGLVPAIRGAYRPTAAGGSRTQVFASHSLQWLLVGVQITLAVTLLTGAGLLVRSFEKLSRVDSGFNTSHVLTFRVSATFGEERDYNRTIERIDRTLDTLTALPGIEAAATTTYLPGVPGQDQREFTLVEGRGAGTAMIAEARWVSPSYFETVQIPLLAGEGCRVPAGAAGATEVLVNRSFVDRYLAGRSPVGLHIAEFKPSPRIVGVVGDARERGADRSPAPTVYTCFSAPTPFPWFLVRTTNDPMAAAAMVRRAINEFEPLRSVYDIETLGGRIDDSFAQNRLRTLVLVLFASTALSLACLGVYGTLSYIVSLRRREVGLRLALGATRSGILRRFVTQGVRVACVACVGGLVLSLAFARALSGMLYGVSSSDPVTLSSVVGIVLTVAALASFVPAARAAFVEPMRILRSE